MNGGVEGGVEESDAFCDDSGLCELADSLRDGENVDRLAARGEDWGAIVDISPLVVGHLLHVPFLHATSAASFECRAFLEHGRNIDGLIAELGRAGLEGVVAVEHGSVVSSRLSCVLHCHTHVCPTKRSAATVEGVLQQIGYVVRPERVVSGWREAREAAECLDEYLLVRATDGILVGRPRRGIRQISRVVLSLCNELPARESDWGIGIRNRAYWQTMTLLAGG